jgi:hypothetical protein
MPSNAQSIQQAITQFQAGRLAEAESVARDQIESDPRQGDAWHVLALVALSRGDTLQFIRYARRVKELGARVVFECPGELFSLLQGVAGIDLAVLQGAPLPGFDLHAPLMSLPRLLGITADAIDASARYIAADTARAEPWRERLSDYPDFRVGVVWRGNPKHKRDHLRSFSPEHLDVIDRVPHVQLFSLQKPAAAHAVPTFNSPGQLIDLAPELTDFAETAAAIKNLDLVISCDSAPAHLAGALGVPVWIALPFVPDWRWLLNRDDSPWYPTARLFRQRERQDWTAVFANMARELATLVDSRK